MLKIGLTVATAALLLSACASQPAPTLEEKLAGKSPSERQVILRAECKDEATKGHKGMQIPRGYDTTYVPHVQRLSKICNEMTNAPANGVK